MHRNRHYMDLERDEKQIRRSNSHGSIMENNYFKDSDEEEFESYTYKTGSYHRNQKTDDALQKRTSSKLYESDSAEKRSSRQVNPELLDRSYSKHNHPIKSSYIEFSPNKKERRQSTHNKNSTYDEESAFWDDYGKDNGKKSREYSQETKKPSYQQDYSLSSATSIVESTSITALGPTGDPNVGLTKKLDPIDSSQRFQILRELKSKISFSDEISTANQLQTETSPTVLVLGGINPENPNDYLIGASMFVYNVKKNRWLFAGTMPEPRNYHSAVYLNGKVYVTGGYSPVEINSGQMTATQSLFRLTIRSKRWRRRSDMHQARACHATCVVEDNLMVLGGRDNAGRLLSTVEMYFPKRDQWSFLKPMPEPIMGMACAVMDGCVYVIGGTVSDGSRSSKFSISNRVYIFDIQKQSWHQKPSLPEPRAFACGASLKREIWVWCGVKDSATEDAYRQSTNTVFGYSPDMKGWEKHTSIGTAKHGAALTKFGRRVYLLGGISNIPAGKEVLDENDCYNKESDKYSEGAPLPRPVTGAAAIALPIDYVGTSDPKWNLDNPNNNLDEAATKIQAVYRGFKTRSQLANNILPRTTTSADITQRGYDPLSEQASKWKLFQRVKIEDWPPVPDPINLPSELNVRLGTLPKGYTVTAVNSSGKTNLHRYVALPEGVDPNLGLCGDISNHCKKTKQLLGLRRVENLPPFCRNMLTVSKLQDDSLPVVLVMGGLQPKDPVNLANGKLILRYIPLKDRFEYFGVLPEPRNYHASVYHRNYIYVIGGCDADKINCGECVSTNTTYRLNIHTNKWEQKADLNCSRSHHCVVVFQGKLYAVGGRDHNGRLVASIEAYDPEEDKWTLKHPMDHPRMGMACAVYANNIWCMGGIGISEDDQMTYPVLTSVISYDIAKDAWSSQPPLRCPRAFATCVVALDSMWLFGGCSRNKASVVLVSMASVDKYYPDEAQWLRRSLLNIPRHGGAVVAVESCVYTFGGTTSQQWGALADTEMVSMTDISLHSCSPLPVALTGLAAVVVPPVAPSLRAESLALLLHEQLTFN
ncbi:hypothetical protein JTE90_003579 [Oedothorax gibbosus]|uniref:Uncharacterized protein n=1 Tax=Oedothorax gibbosus TaxID=931172 RepID=A0AAV6VK86_9ARAC|nr:hypothetical protein JTE90_003579 [Oedothorax gibbosus]